jgi:hypothetical protein
VRIARSSERPAFGCAKLLWSPDAQRSRPFLQRSESQSPRKRGKYFPEDFAEMRNALSALRLNVRPIAAKENQRTGFSLSAPKRSTPLFSVLARTKLYSRYTNEIMKSAEVGSGKSQRMCQTPGSNFELTTFMCLNPRKSSQNFTAKMYCKENSSTYQTTTARTEHLPWLKLRGFRDRSLWQ